MFLLDVSRECVLAWGFSLSLFIYAFLVSDSYLLLLVYSTGGVVHVVVLSAGTCLDTRTMAGRSNMCTKMLVCNDVGYS
ncbi:hypothetical protein BDY21DRAFT_342150 [Lineolata rhizophorae]|uniref:Uncharacterized protein n=1 Tax=Lineolata rhizophorae TaxID=578093 RepID=A0A6A6P3J0_9PEZI|nr:hypothetical protein BDY21DRAFT_342150 [Lineolata rhizophorae]